MTTLTLSKARETLGDAVNAVAYGRGRVVIQRHGKNVAAIVSMADLEALRRLEGRLFGEEASRRLDDRADAVVSHADAMKELGLERRERAAGTRRRKRAGKVSASVEAIRSRRR